MGNLNQPVIFNIITIATLLFCIYQVVEIAPGRTMPATDEALQILARLSQENDVADVTLALGLANDQVRRQRLTYSLVVTMSIAILANAIANLLGRQRQRTNVARIRNLEAELRGERSRRASNEG